MNNRIVLIAYQDQENLGVAYLASMLLSKGFEVENVDFGLREDEVIQHVDTSGLLMIGFSLIFQYHFDKLLGLAHRLREDGITCHFTVGGHYPSLRFANVLEGIPEIDSVVRFEGEVTACELAEKLALGVDWKTIGGIAYRRNGVPVSTEVRPLISDLDVLPFPFRRKEASFECMGKNCATILASRGCIRNCAFCSIRKFYGTPRGKLRRSRSPRNVVQEMKELYETHDTRIFLFQDDDFFLPGRVGREWIYHFIGELDREGLSSETLWKISCRTDEVESDLFKRLKEAGLSLAYLGIESGNPTGLRALNKGLNVEDNVTAVRTLNNLQILYDFGFMLFDPTSTFASVRENVNFLREICGDGSSPVVFCKMIPYAETDIERTLMRDGRLKGSIINPDYDFLDPKLNDYYSFLHETFNEWMFTRQGMLARLRWNQFEVAVLEKFYPHAKSVPEYKNSLREIIARSNGLFFRIAENAASVFEGNSSDHEDELLDIRRVQSEAVQDIDRTFHERIREFRLKQL